MVFIGFDSDLPEFGTISKIIVFGNQDIYFLIITIIQHLNIINIFMHVTTRIILLFFFFASLHDNLFVFLFLLFCYYLSLLALRNTPVDYVTKPFTYSFIYCSCISFGSSFS